MSIALDRCCFVVSLAMPQAVVLSTWMGVGGCGHPMSVNVCRIAVASLQLTKRDPNSASVADDIACFKILQSVCIAPFNFVGLLGLGASPRKKCPPALLRACRSDK